MNAKKRKICVITGTRAEYGLLRPLMKAIKKSERNILKVIVTGMHLSRRFGMTFKEIEKDGFKIDAKVEIISDKDNDETMAEVIGKGILGISRALNKIKPDIVVVLGDRIEVLAGAISSVYLNIPLAHIHGGDSARAGLDEYSRHAVTKISHFHFPATRKSAERIVKMGEDAWRIKVVGAPCLDEMRKGKLTSKKELSKKYNLDLTRPVLLVVQHPVTTEPENSFFQMAEIMEAVKNLRIQAILIYPNSDTGEKEMRQVINKYKNLPFLRIYSNIPRQDYLGLIKTAGALVGNSSSGIIEAPSFHLPVVNIGKRQEGRERAENVLDVGYDRRQIIKAVKKCLFDKKFKQEVKKCQTPYGKAGAAEKILNTLNRVRIDKKLFEKKLTY